MASRHYWEIFVDEFVPEMGIVLTPQQRNEMVDAIVGHAEMESEATGQAIFSANRRGYLEKELEDAKKATRFEEEKILCATCEGKGTLTSYRGTFMSTSQCYECRGQGRVHPSKASAYSLGVR